MKLIQLTTTSLILTALALPTAVAQLGPGVLRTGEYAAVVEFSADSPLVQNVPVTELPAAAPLQSRVIDLAICLDTSGSMDGLIDSAKQRLWSIVNDLALADPAPELRVALLTFGNDGHDAENGWVRVDAELTGDLDRISQQLFALQTNGGTELVGRVLNVATGKLNWSQDPHALKLAVVAGNESADQDAVVPFREACATAIKNGIMVNSIYCGSPTDAEAPLWKEVSLRADGHFATIDHQNGTLAIDTPFDEQLVALTSSVNPTYLPFGAEGESAWVNQTAQDTNAFGLNNDAAANRAMCKNGALYVCDWDLVDASKQEGFDLAAIPVEQLPEVMRTMTLEERQAHIEKTAKERAEIQAQIAEVGVQREAWLQAEMQRLSLDESKSFDHQLRTAIRAQASQNGFKFPAPAVVTAADTQVGAEAQPAAGVAPAGAVQQGAVQTGNAQQVANPGAQAQQPAQPAPTGNAIPAPRAPAPASQQQLVPADGQTKEAAQEIAPLDC